MKLIGSKRIFICFIIASFFIIKSIYDLETENYHLKKILENKVNE